MGSPGASDQFMHEQRNPFARQGAVFNGPAHQFAMPGRHFHEPCIAEGSDDSIVVLDQFGNRVFHFHARTLIPAPGHLPSRQKFVFKAHGVNYPLADLPDSIASICRVGESHPGEFVFRMVYADRSSEYVEFNVFGQGVGNMDTEL